jgi:hypothetical protein
MKIIGSRGGESKTKAAGGIHIAHNGGGRAIEVKGMDIGVGGIPGKRVTGVNGHGGNWNGIIAG